MPRTKTTEAKTAEPKATEVKTPARIVTTLLAAAAVSAVLAGCSRSTTARCVDQSGNVLSDSACPGSGGGGYVGGGYVGGSYGGGYGRAQPRWVYGGGGGMTPGSRATGFSTSPPDSGSIHSSSGTVLRGGFGSAGESHGSFGHGSGE